MFGLERPMLREAPAHKSRPRCQFGADDKFGADGWGRVQGPWGWWRCGALFFRRITTGATACSEPRSASRTSCAPSPASCPFRESNGPTHHRS